MAAQRFSLRAVTFAVMAGIYLLLSGQSSADELVAAVTIAAVAVALAEALSRISERRFAPGQIGWFRLAGETLMRLLSEVVAVGTVLTARHPSNGRFERQHISAPRESAEAQAGRRGVVTLITSLTPGSFVIGVLTAHRELLLHRLGPELGGP